MFITLDGVDGSGKSSIAKALHAHLESKWPDKKIHLTREPGGKGLHVGEELRSIILSNQYLTPETVLMLLVAARIEHCRTFIIPALLNGAIVICDRFSASTFVYQRVECQVDLPLYTSSRDVVQKLFTDRGLSAFPDVQLLLDVDYDTSRARLEARTDQKLNFFDTASEQTFINRRCGYLAYAQTPHFDNGTVISADRTPQEVFSDCLSAVDARFAQQGKI